MSIIITKVEEGRVVKYLPIGDDDYEAKLAEVKESFPDAFMYHGDYLPSLFVNEEGQVSSVPVVVPLTLRDYDIAIERHLDAEAEAAGYYDPLGRIPSIDRACSYAAFPSEYQAEGQSFVAWRAAVWSHVYEVQLAVQAEQLDPPSIEDLIAGLPQREA